MDSIASESQQGSASEDCINRVFCLKGHVTHSQFNLRVCSSVVVTSISHELIYDQF